MKKTLKLFLISLACFGFCLNASAMGINNVPATGTAVGIGYGIEYTTTGACAGCNYGRNEKFTKQYYVEIDNPTGSGTIKAPVYCLDPHKKDTNALKVSSVVNLNSTTKYYKGILAISKAVAEKYNYYNNSFDPNNKYDGKFEAVQDAYRMLRVAARQYLTVNTCTGGGDENLKYYGILAAQIMNDNKSLANAALGTSCNSVECFYNNALSTLPSACKANYATDNASIAPKKTSQYNMAKELFIIGLEGMAGESSYMNGESAKASIKESSLKGATPGNSGLKLNKYYDIKVENFADNNVLKNIVLEPVNVPSNAKVYISGYSTDNGKTFVETSKIDNSVLSSIKGNKTIVIQVTAEAENYNCEDIKFKLKYQYTAIDYGNSYAVILSANNATGNAQNFIVPIYQEYTTGVNAEKLVDNNDAIDGTVNFCNTLGSCIAKNPENMTDDEKMECCDDWSNACDNGNNTYCGYYGTYCAACDTEIIIPNVCQLTEDGESSDVIVDENTTGSIVSAIDDDGNENIKACLLMRKEDEAGHSYEALKNSYCAVYCKEDFTFNLPELQKLNSGTYFQLDATITGTKTCYTSKIDTNKFLSEISGLDTSSQAYKEKVNEYNACVNMEVDYSCFNPEIEYKYEEIYNDQLGENNKFIQSGDVVESNKETTYCNGEINDDYSCTDGSTKAVSNIKGVAFTTNYVMSTVTKIGTYITPSVFYTNVDGSISTNGSATNASLINGLPVALNSTQGRHNFTLSLGNIGEFYDDTSCTLGRIVGAEDSIYNKQQEDAGNSGIFKAEYMCYYDVNCPECEFDCEGPLCEITDCGGKACEVACLGNGCAYNNDYGLSYAYRTVSLNNLNPSNRALGYNWSTDVNQNKAAAKVSAAMNEIQTAGETTYEKKSYSFTLTPSVITALKDHNNSELPNGGFANNSLECENYTFNGVTYQNVNCKSKLIEDLASGVYGNVNVTIPDEEERFINWPESEYCKNNTCSVEIGIGPSYK